MNLIILLCVELLAVTFSRPFTILVGSCGPLCDVSCEIEFRCSVLIIKNIGMMNVLFTYILIRNEYTSLYHCVKSVRIWSYYVPYFPAFGLNTERYGVSLLIQSERGKIRTRITLNANILHAEHDGENILQALKYLLLISK